MSVKSLPIVKKLSSINDLSSFRGSTQKVSEIEIDGTYFITKGLLRHALKYAYSVCREGAFIKINAKGLGRTFGFSNKEYSFWQVRHESAKVLGDRAIFTKIDSDIEVIELRVINEWRPPRSITFGIVFSGKPQEEDLLNSVLTSIDKIIGLNRNDCDVIIIGSGDYDIESIRSKYSELNIMYESIDCVDEAGRFLTCVKKSRIFDLACRDVLVVCHTRIKFPKDFFSKISNVYLECASPKVFCKVGGSSQPYLDYVLVGSYDLARLNPRRSLTSEDFGDNYLNHLGRRVPYVDGGVVMFDKRVIKSNPYNKNIAWGEAEDVDMCGRLYQDGILIDYAFEITCESVTNKLSYAKNELIKGMYKVKRKLALAIDF